MQPESQVSIENLANNLSKFSIGYLVLLICLKKARISKANALDILFFNEGDSKKSEQSDSNSDFTGGIGQRNDIAADLRAVDAKSFVLSSLHRDAVTDPAENSLKTTAVH